VPHTESVFDSPLGRAEPTACTACGASAEACGFDVDIVDIMRKAAGIFEGA